MGSHLESSIKVRGGRLEDVPQIVDLGSRVFTTAFGYSVEPHQLQAYLDEAYTIPAITADITNPAKDTIVATDGENGLVVGFAIMTRGTREPCIEHVQSKVELQRLYVDIGMHGKGIGKLLARTLETMARSQGFRHMWLGVWEENLVALKTYDKLGYKRVGEHDFKVGDIVQTDNIMIKQL
jgi:ribosomal protein S18 acetylase RimI-like enzyme